MAEKYIYALGFFDGVHMAHGALLHACREIAAEQGCIAGAVTFNAHPDALVSGAAPQLLTTRQDRQRLMRHLYGIGHLVCLPFDKAMMQMPWKTFFQMLRRRYHAAGFVCGHDFRFGAKGEGNAQLLLAACREEGIPCRIVPEQKIDGITVSSSHIRTLLENGDLDNASRFLGHPHVFTGMVVPGQHLGHILGFPTANLLLPQELLCPKLGVYACKAWVDGCPYPAVTNIGTRPTVGGRGITVESWLLDFHGDLYGKEITLEFYAYLRPEQKFNSLAQLQQEIRKNGEETRNYFEKK